jgi:type IV pilus biogenesis protein CpaD/CtpE
MNKKNVYVCVLSLAVLACSPPPAKEAYFNRGEPESLLDYSSEVVNVKVSSSASVQELVDAVNKEQPTRAEVVCDPADPVCKEVKNVMQQFGVQAKYRLPGPGAPGSVALMYDRLQARNCQNRYIDNTVTGYNNLNHPTFGCSTAVNIVQMVTDKRQFTDPGLLDMPNAAKPLQAAGYYNAASKPDTSFPTMVESGFSGSGGSR